MRTYVERMSIAVENDILRDRCKNNIRFAKQALESIKTNGYFSKEQVANLRALMNKIINN